jgi:hypothetical protein
MSDVDAMLVNGSIGSAFTVVSLALVRFLWYFFHAVNHKRIRSACCGQTCVASLDVEGTTPQAHPEPAVPSLPSLPALHVIVDQVAALQSISPSSTDAIPSSSP